MTRIGRLVVMVLMALGAGLGAQAAMGQAAVAGVTAAPTILTLDQERLYRESRFGKAREKEAADAVALLAEENRKLAADLAAEEKSLTEERAKLTPEAFAPLAEAFDAKVERIRADQDAKSRAVQEKRDAGRKDFFQAAAPVLAELMRQRGALAILNKDAVFLAFDALDVTDAAIAAIDAKLGDGSAASGAPAP